MRDRTQLNLASPFTARKWLRLICADPVSGIRIKRNINVGPEYLGFSFRSNAVGLHGPLALDGGNVVMGTSFAMGLGVDEDANWWKLALQEKAWLNLGLPVGIRWMKRLFEQVHRGPCKRLVFVYHPNLIPLSRQFDRLSETQKDPFRAFGWKTGILECLMLTLRGFFKRRRMISAGELLILPRQLGGHEIDCRYCRYDLADGTEYAERSFIELCELFQAFDECIVIRASIKQEVVGDPHRTPTLRAIQTNYAEVWQLLRRKLSTKRNVRVIEPHVFGLQHFFPYDTHWNQEGNRVFSKLVGAALQQ